MKELCNLFIRVVLSFSLIFTPSFANLPPITPDGQTNTTTDVSSEHNIPVVNIAKPSDGGVSYNTYTNFNVDANGIIINNSTQIGTTNLGGQLYANPNFGTGNAADIILNEVTTNSTSTLLGPTEIFGKTAEFILANPNGITCNGCGFINTSRLGLITGTPHLDSNGNIQNFTMPNGTGFVKLIGDSANQLIALNASNVDYVDIISNVVEITGKVYANKELNIKTGNQNYDYATRQVSSNSTNLAGQISIDARNFGAMQAGKIELVASQLGVGVNLDLGIIQASTGDLVITADGNLVSSSSLQAAGNAQISVNKLENLGDIIAGNNANITSLTTVDNQGAISANNDLSLTAQGDVTNSGSLVGVNNLSLQSQNDVINSGTIQSGGDLTITNTNNLVTQVRLSL